MLEDYPDVAKNHFFCFLDVYVHAVVFGQEFRIITGNVL